MLSLVQKFQNLQNLTKNQVWNIIENVKIIKAQAGFKQMTYWFVFNTLTHCAQC